MKQKWLIYSCLLFLTHSFNQMVGFSFTWFIFAPPSSPCAPPPRLFRGIFCYRYLPSSSATHSCLHQSLLLPTLSCFSPPHFHLHLLLPPSSISPFGVPYYLEHLSLCWFARFSLLSYFLHIRFNKFSVFLFSCGKDKLLFQIFCFPFFCILPPPLFASPLPLLCSFCGPYYCQRLSLEQIASLLKLQPGRPCRPLLLYCPL